MFYRWDFSHLYLSRISNRFYRSLHRRNPIILRLLLLRKIHLPWCKVLFYVGLLHRGIILFISVIVEYGWYYLLWHHIKLLYLLLLIDYLLILIIFQSGSWSISTCVHLIVVRHSLINKVKLLLIVSQTPRFVNWCKGRCIVCRINCLSKCFKWRLWLLEWSALNPSVIASSLII